MRARKSGPSDLAPYRPNGDLCHHERGDLKSGEEADWRPIEPFRATLVYAGYARGRSAAYFYWKDVATGISYPMFMSGMDQVMDSGFVEGNRITGRFTVVKKGQNYGLSYLGPAEESDS